MSAETSRLAGLGRLMVTEEGHPAWVTGAEAASVQKAVWARKQR